MLPVTIHVQDSASDGPDIFLCSSDMSITPFSIYWERLSRVVRGNLDEKGCFHFGFHE